jgi:hypothetical protein
VTRPDEVAGNVMLARELDQRRVLLLGRRR